MAIIIDGKSEDLPSITSRSFVDDPTLELRPQDCRARTGWVRSVVLHTTKGIPGGQIRIPQKILPGLGVAVGAGKRTSSCWANDGRAGGAHLVVDFDGAVTCHADLQTTAAYHAGAANQVSIGIEIYQGAGGELYEGQLEVVVALVDWLTRRFGIQRQTPAAYAGAPIDRLEAGGRDFVGVFGHRDCSGNRGAGDPGDEIFRMLWVAGYEAFDLEAEADMAVWKGRQTDLGLAPADGVPGPRTLAALLAAGRPAGMWVRRPGDAPAVA